MLQRLLLALAVALVLGGAWPPSARAEDDALSVAVDPDLEEIAALRARGGHLSVHRLRALARQGGPEVRRAALDALAHVGLRSTGAAEAARRALETTDAGERGAALRALGRIGDGRDLEAFLGALREEDAALRKTALQGLRELTGRRLPVSPTRCSLWWRSSARGLREGVRTALEAIAHAETDRHVVVSLETIARDGWVDLKAVSEAAREWLRGSDHRLRGAAFRVAASLRLADLAADVESALPFVSEVDARAGAEAARALGVPLELMPPVWRRRLEEEAPSDR